MKIQRRSVLAGVLMVVVGGCGPEMSVVQEDRVSTDATTSSAQALRERQGRKLTGGDDLRMFVQLPQPSTAFADLPRLVSGQPVERVGVVAATLDAYVPSSSGDWRRLLPHELLGMTFQGESPVLGAKVEVRIEGARPHEVNGSVVPGETAYVLRYRRVYPVADATFSDLCPTPAGNGGALPVLGSWNATGDHVFAPDQLTFACLDGAISKCIDWGYKPWAITLDHAAPERSYHQACTRLARADYCGDNQSNTKEGTLVELWDNSGRPRAVGLPAEAGAPSMFFEAAWRPNGTVLCFSKKRWSTLPLGGLCSPALPDPRLVPAGTPGSEYCDDLPGVSPGTSAPPSPGHIVPPLLFNNSYLMDEGLFTWTQSKWAQRYFTTTDGFFGGAARPSDTIQPAPGFLVAQFEGVVFHRALPATALPKGTVPLMTYVHAATGKRFTGTAPPKAWTVNSLSLQPLPTSPKWSQKKIGYVFSPALAPPPGARPLYSYFHAVRGEYLTTAGKPPVGFAKVRLEGYLSR